MQVSTPEQAIAGIKLRRIDGALLHDERVDVWIGVQAIGRTRHDEAVHPLQGPAILGEFAGEPIQQLGVRRLFGHVAEIIGGRDEALAEVLEPNAIHRDAGGQRVILARDGLRQLQAAAPFGIGLTVPGRQDVQELPGGDGAALVLVTTQVDIAVTGAVGIGHGHGFARHAGVRQAEFVDLRETEMARGRAVILPPVDGAILPVIAELTGVEHRDELLVVQDGLHIRHGPRVAGQLRHGGRSLLAAVAGFSATGNVGEDRVLGVRIDLLVGHGDVIDGLRLQVAERGGDQRVHRMLLVRQGRGEYRRGAFGEFSDRNRGTTGERPGDGRINLHAHGLKVRQRRLELVAFINVAPFGGTTLEGRCYEATGHLPVVTGAHLADIFVETGGAFLLQGHQALLEIGPLCGGVGRRNRGALEGLNRRGEDPMQGVVVGRRDGVELMVMAAGAGDREPEEGLGRGIDALIDGVVLIVKTLTDGDEAEGGEARVFLLQVREAVGGQLFGDELVVRLIRVQRIDDVITERPSVGVAIVFKKRVALVDGQSTRVGIAGRIEPVAGPAFPVMRRGQQFIHFLGNQRVDRLTRLAALDAGRIRRDSDAILSAEGVDLIRRGRQADQIIMNATQERLRVGGGVGLQASGFKLCQDEGINGIMNPGLILHLGHHGLHHGLKGPVVAGFLRKASQLVTGTDRTRRAHLDPLFQYLDFGVGNLPTCFLRRHLELVVGIGDGTEQQRFPRVARHDGGTFVAALEHPVTRIQDEAAFRGSFGHRVALIAMLRQNGADVLLEEFEALFGGLWARVGGDGESCAAQSGKKRQAGEGNVHGQRRADEGLNSDP